MEIPLDKCMKNAYIYTCILYSYINSKMERWREKPEI